MSDQSNIELYVKDFTNNTRHLVGFFQSIDDVMAFYACVYDILKVNDEQHLLIVKHFNKDQQISSDRQAQVSKRELVGVFKTVEEIQQHLTDIHEIVDHSNNNAVSSPAFSCSFREIAPNLSNDDD